MEASCSMVELQSEGAQQECGNLILADQLAKQIILKAKAKAPLILPTIPYIVKSDFCRRCKKTVTNLANHLGNFHNHASATCGYCYKVMKRTNLKRHTNSVHKGKEPNPSGSNSLKCYYCNICFDDELSATGMYTQYFNAHVTYCSKNLFNKETLHCCGIVFSNHDKRKLHIEAVHRQPQCIERTEMASDAAVKEFLENKCLSTSLFVNQPITQFYKPPHKETVCSVNFQISEYGLQLSRAGLAFSVLKNVMQHIIDTKSSTDYNYLSVCISCTAAECDDFRFQLNSGAELDIYAVGFGPVFESGNMLKIMKAPIQIDIHA